jgi:general secretion pathway protein D
VPDERSNTLLIYAHRRDLVMITNIVAKMDMLLAQVLIEAVIVEVRLGNSQSLGVSMAQNPRRFGGDFTGGGGVNNGQLGMFNAATNFPGALPGGLSYFGRLGDDLDIALSAIAQDSQINILSRPRIQTSHAIEGSFIIGETVPYVTGSVFDYFGGGVGGGNQRSSIQEKRIALELYVTPFITPENLVVMEIRQIFDQRGSDVLIDGNPVPIVNTREANATLTVRSGDSIMLGGFIAETKTQNKSGVPILKDIPGLGALFRTKTDSNDRAELVVLMRATVLTSPEAAAITAVHETSQLHGVRQAERGFQKTEEKRARQAR